MLHKISRNDFLGHGPIKVLYPGAVLSRTETGIGSIGRIDHPEFHGNTVIAMHPHINDEILSYFRTGKAEHTDSSGFAKTIGGNTLMLMRAGSLFQHEESILGADETFEGLQIFIRPGKKNLEPNVTFVELDDLHSEKEWRLLASPTEATPFQFSSQTWIYDRKLLKGSQTALPALPRTGLTCLLYVFQGAIQVNGNLPLQKMEGILIQDEEIQINTNDVDAEVVLFVTDETSETFDGGMFSGNQA